MGLVRVGGMFAGILLCRSVLCDIVVLSGQRLAVGFEVLKWWMGLREGLIWQTARLWGLSSSPVAIQVVLVTHSLVVNGDEDR